MIPTARFRGGAIMTMCELVSAFNEFCVRSKMAEYIIYSNDDDGFRSLDYKDIRDLLKIDDFRQWLGGPNHA